jgi:hypothetical protein
MLFKRISRTDAEKVYIVVQNVSGGTLTAGYSCAFDLSSVDGVRVSQPITAALQAFAGIADADIADSGYGLVQVYGYRSSAYIHRSTEKATAAGVELELQNAQWGLTPVGGAVSSGQTKAFAFLCEAVTSSSGTSYTTAKVFVRAL